MNIPEDCLSCTSERQAQSLEIQAHSAEMQASTAQTQADAAKARAIIAKVKAEVAREKATSAKSLSEAKARIEDRDDVQHLARLNEEMRADSVEELVEKASDEHSLDCFFTGLIARAHAMKSNE